MPWDPVEPEPLTPERARYIRTVWNLNHAVMDENERTDAINAAEAAYLKEVA